jgi:hypothetical protein
LGCLQRLSVFEPNAGIEIHMHCEKPLLQLETQILSLNFIQLARYVHRLTDEDMNPGADFRNHRAIPGFLIYPARGRGSGHGEQDAVGLASQGQYAELCDSARAS